jgi:cobalt/nickel transport protein
MMMKFEWSKKWTIALLAMIIASPIGILMVWNYDDAWGEWGEVEKYDWTPSSYWTAPMPDYNFDGWSSQLDSSVGYIISAIVGVLVIIGVTYLAFSWVANKDKKTKN